MDRRTPHSVRVQSSGAQAAQEDPGVLEGPWVLVPESLRLRIENSQDDRTMILWTGWFYENSQAGIPHKRSLESRRHRGKLLQPPYVLGSQKHRRTANHQGGRYVPL